MITRVSSVIRPEGRGDFRSPCRLCAGGLLSAGVADDAQINRSGLASNPRPADYEGDRVGWSGGATPPLTCTDGSCRFLWVLVLKQPGWLPLVVSGRRETSSPAASPGGRTRGTGAAPSEQFAVRAPGASVRTPARRRPSQFMPAPGARCGVGGGRRTMYQDVRWFPGVPGAPAGITPR
jgi:hypothetical protein